MKRFFSLTLLHKFCRQFIGPIKILHFYTFTQSLYILHPIDSNITFLHKVWKNFIRPIPILNFYTFTQKIKNSMSFTQTNLKILMSIQMKFTVLHFYTKSVEPSLGPLQIFYINTLLHKN